MFCSLHNHTQYSNLKLRDSINRIPDMVDKALEYGFNGLAITDHEVISGHIEALEIADKIKQEHPDFKIILGNEAYLIDKEEYKNAEKYWHFILLACDEIGHKQLRILSSRAWERSYKHKGQKRCPTFYSDIEEVIGNDKGHIIASTACLGGKLATKILQHDVKAVSDLIYWGINTFGIENFFLEMQDADTEEQQRVNSVIVSLSQQSGVQYIITQDAHYLNKEDLVLFGNFLNSKEEKEREVEAFYKYTYMKSESEMKQILSYMSPEDVQKGIDNTQIIYNRIKDYDIRRDTVVPARKIPEFQLEHLLKDWYGKYSNIEFFSKSPYDQDQYLLYLIEQGIKEKNFVITDLEAKRIDDELDTLKYISDLMGQPMSAYLNVVQEIVNIMWQVSFVGVSRGSAASFLINYLIGITQFNPIPYKIPFWRFLNKASVRKGMSAADSLPDVDVDESGEKQEEIMQLMKEYYGYDKVINTLTYHKESLKSAIQTACRGLDINVDESRAISSLVPVSRGHVYTLKECEEGDDEKGFEPAPQVIQALHKIPHLYETVSRIEGLISGAGVHASAVYITKDPYTEYCSAMKANNGTLITGFDYHGVNAVGMLKFDFLFTDCQTKLMKCVELMLKAGVIQWQGSLRATYNKYLHPDVLDYNNPKMWKDMSEGKITDLFQFNTPVGSVCIKRTKPTSVQQLGAANAVMRLMPQEGQESPLDRYVKFKNDISLWYKEMRDYGLNEDEIKVLEEECLDSFGVAPEQENMMLLVQRPEISNFTLGEANTMRKAISKKQLKKIQQCKDLFFSKNIDKEEE